MAKDLLEMQHKQFERLIVFNEDSGRVVGKVTWSVSMAMVRAMVVPIYVLDSSLWAEAMTPNSRGKDQGKNHVFMIYIYI